MYHAATTAYAKVSQAVQSPRELEAAVLIRAAQRLQSAKDNWAPEKPDFDAALSLNRKVWTILSAAATEPDNPLPDHIKTGIAQLAAVVFQRTVDIMIEPAAEKLALLVRINREIAAGLRGMPQPA